MADKNGNKVSVKQLYDEIIPMIENIAGIKTDISNIKDDIRDIRDDMKTYCDSNEKAHGEFITGRSLKNISIIMSIVMAIVTIWNTYIFFAG
jgi:hypothetical protein